MNFTNSGYISYKGLILTLVASGITILALYLFRSAMEEQSENNFIQAANQTEEVQNRSLIEILNVNPDTSLKETMNSMVNSPLLHLIVVAIIFTTTILSFFGFKQFEKSYAGFIFGLYSGLAQSIIYNMICFGCLERMNFHFGIENTLLGLGAGLFSSFIVMSYYGINTFLKSLPEIGMNLSEWVWMRISFRFLSPNLATLQSWTILFIVSSGIIYVIVK